MRGQSKVRLLEKTPSNALRLDFVDEIFPDCKVVHIIRHGFDSVPSIEHYWNQASHGLKNIDPNRLGQRLREIRLRQVPHYAREFMLRVMPLPRGQRLKGNLWGPRIPGLEALVEQMDLFEVCCLQWRMCVELACHQGRRLPTDRYMEIRLEDMSRETVTRVLDFCGLEDEDVVMDYLNQTFKGHRVGARMKEVAPEKRDIMEQWLRPTLNWLGYE